MSDAIPPKNPYEAPTARLSDPTIAGALGELIENGRNVPAGHGPGWIGRGWELFKVAPGAWIGIFLIYVVIVLLVNFIPFIGRVINIFVHVLLLGGVMTVCNTAEKNQVVRVSDLFSGFSSHPGPLALLGLLHIALYLAAGIVIGILAVISFGGLAALGALNPSSMTPAMIGPFIALFVVGFVLLILVGMATWFAPPLIVLQGIKPIDALRMSFLACMKNILAVLLGFIVFLLLAVVATLPIGLGWLVLGPVMFCSIYAGFRDMFFAPA